MPVFVKIAGPNEKWIIQGGQGVQVNSPVINAHFLSAQQPHAPLGF
jgi:hypothetical protein